MGSLSLIVIAMFLGIAAIVQTVRLYDHRMRILDLEDKLTEADAQMRKHFEGKNQAEKKLACVFEHVECMLERYRDE